MPRITHPFIVLKSPVPAIASQIAGFRLNFIDHHNVLIRAFSPTGIAHRDAALLRTSSSPDLPPSAQIPLAKMSNP